MGKHAALVLFFVLVAGLHILFILAPAYTGRFLGDPPSVVVRGMNATVEGGTAFNVTLRILPRYGEAFYAVEETIPSGFNLSDPGSGNYSPAERKIRFYQLNLSDPNASLSEENISYTLVSPWAPGAYSFSGVFQFEGDNTSTVTLGDTLLDVYSTCNQSFSCTEWTSGTCGDRTCTCSCNGGVGCLGDGTSHVDCPVQQGGSSGGGGGGGGSPLFGKLDIIRKNTTKPAPPKENDSQAKEPEPENVTNPSPSVLSVIDSLFTAENSTEAELVTPSFSSPAEVRSFFGFLNWLIIGILCMLFLWLLMLKRQAKKEHRTIFELKRDIEAGYRQGRLRKEIIDACVKSGWSKPVVEGVCLLVEKSKKY